MKRIKHIISSIALCIVILVGFIFPVACSGDDASRLIIEGQKTVFNVGDEFTTGNDFKVYLESDGKQTDVTQDVEVNPEKRLDMNVADEYAVTVSYGKKKEVYYIVVNDSEPTLTKISADASAAKTDYKVGESISYEGLKLIGTYKNAQNKLYDAEITSWSPYRFEITSQYGGEYEDVFVSEGEHTVKISRGELSATYTVNVSGVNFESVKSGIGLGKYFQKNVVSGSFSERSLGMTHTYYAFGNNYTYINILDAGTTQDYYVSIVNGKADITYFYENSKTTAPVSTVELINGACIKAWYFDDLRSSYGIEDLIGDLYDIGIKDPNKDYAEEVDAEQKTFTFSFGYVNKNGKDRRYYWETFVQFTLGDSNFIESATITQNTWFSVYNNLTDTYTDHYVTDEKTGVTKPKPDHYETDEETGEQIPVYIAPDFVWSVTCSQEAGTRVMTNPYLTEEGNKSDVQDYKIYFNGKEIKDGDVIDIEQGNKNAMGHYRQYVLKIGDILPESASFNGDPLYVTDGTANKEDSANWFYGTNFQLFGSWDSNDKTIEPQRGGLYYLEFTTKNTTKKIWFNVTGANPTKLTPQVYNPTNKVLTNMTQKSVGIGETVYFSCIPDGYSNGAFTAKLTSGNQSDIELIAPDTNATPDEIAANPTLKYWSFKASEAGTYVITMTSLAALNVETTLTITVKAIDFVEILNGSYSVEDSAGGIYTVKFTPDGEGFTAGQVEISYTKDSEAKVVYKYSVVNGKLELGDLVSGDSLGVSLSANTDDKLILTDRYGNNYLMSRES